MADSICDGKTTQGEADKNKGNLLKNILEFNRRTRLNTKSNKTKTTNAYEIINFLYEGRELVCHDFNSGIILLTQI